MRENPPMWIEENEDENLKEIFIVATRISCKSLSKLLCFLFFLEKDEGKKTT
jgi:hypothetical protein